MKGRKTSTPGQQARVAIGGNSRPEIISQVNTAGVIAWKNGLFQFNETSIQSIMRQVCRWYDIDVVYEGKIEQPFSGKISRGVKLSALLKILESAGGVHFMIEGRKITVAP